MGRRGVSYGGGESSLGYLFGGGGGDPTVKNENEVPKSDASTKPTTTSTASSGTNRDIPAGIRSNMRNNFYRPDGQNCGNFITDRPSTKVHAEPGGGSSLGYLFGGHSK